MSLMETEGQAGMVKGDKKRGLGRGLDALFGDEEVFPGAAPKRAPVVDAAPPPAGGPHRRLAGIDQLQPGQFQPRQTIDAASLAELSTSIAAHGILQPILVRPLGPNDDRFEIIAGERRWRAAQAAQLHEVPVILKNLTDAQALEIALIENLQRADLNALEEAIGFQRLADEFGHTQEQLAEKLGKSRSYIANATRLLHLPASVQMLLRDGKLTAGHARALVGSPQAEKLAHEIVARHLSVRDAERLAKRGQGSAPGKPGTPLAKDVDTLALEKEISDRLGYAVTISMKGDGKGGRNGSLSIAYKSLDQLDDILKRLSR